MHHHITSHHITSHHITSHTDYSSYLCRVFQALLEKAHTKPTIAHTYIHTYPIPWFSISQYYTSSISSSCITDIVTKNIKWLLKLLGININHLLSKCISSHAHLSHWNTSFIHCNGPPKKFYRCYIKLFHPHLNPLSNFESSTHSVDETWPVQFGFIVGSR